MKVLIVANYKESAGGISGQVKLLYNNLKREGISTEIFNTKGSLLTRLKFFKTFRKKAKDFDLIHVHCCSGLGFYPAILAIKSCNVLNKRIILTYHGGGADQFFARYSWIVRKYLNRTNGNIVLSGFLASIFDKYSLPYSIIPNILENNNTELRIKDEVSPKFISVRTLAPIYNVECIIKAFEIVKKEIPAATLTVLGDGICRKELEEYVKNKDIKDINFKGHVPNTEIDRYLKENDIFLSMPKIDNQPMSVLEAWRNGLLVISSNVGGIPYLIENKKTGLLVESNDINALANNMIWVIKNQKDSLEIISNGQRELKKYSWERIGPKILNLYRGRPPI